MSRLTPLYSVKLIADGKQHFYELENDPVWKPGVTTALNMLNKPALIPWAVKSVSDNIKEALLARNGNPLTKEEIETIVTEGKNIYKKKSQEAADLGSRVHKAIDEIIHGREPVLTDDIKAGVEGFLQWKASHSLKIELGDTKLGSRLFGYGGSLDFLAFDGSEPIIFDIKTTKKRKDRDHGIYDEYAFQLAAYAQAFKETYGLDVKSVYCLWVNKEKPEFKPVKVGNIPACLDGFLAALKLYNLSKWEKFDREVA